MRGDVKGRAGAGRRAGVAAAVALFAVLGLASTALAQTTPWDELVIVAPTPLRGARIDADKLPGTTEILGKGDFARTGSLSATDAFEQHAPGVSLADTQGNVFAKTLDFRGFEASPLQGAPQGLAVYMGGVRLNETFGDTVNFDLIPETAIDRADLFTSNPAFGLNALGGAINLGMKTGFTAKGLDASLEGGAFGRVYGSAEYGVTSGPWAAYAAIDGGHETGWRLHSPSTVGRLYGDLGWKRDRAELHLVASIGDNTLGVIGPTPADMVEADRRSVYTYPQATQNQSGLIALNGGYDLGQGWSLQGDVHGRGFNQSHMVGRRASR